MKQLSSLLIICLLVIASKGNAQSFSAQHDTVKINVSGTYNALNNLTNLTADTISLVWQVHETNFPDDWKYMTGICDIESCWGSGDLWPVVPKDPRYPPGMWDFHLQGDLSDVTTDGPYYLQVRVSNKDIPAHSLIQTYIVGKGSASVMTASKSSSDEIMSLYPNPATTSLNVGYNGIAGVASVAVYSIIGRQMNIYKSLDNSASLNIEHIPPGIYIVKLLNAQGYVIAAQRFTKQ